MQKSRIKYNNSLKSSLSSEDFFRYLLELFKKKSYRKCMKQRKNSYLPIQRYPRDCVDIENLIMYSDTFHIE